MTLVWIVLGIAFSVLCVAVGFAAILTARPRYYGQVPPHD